MSLVHRSLLFPTNHDLRVKDLFHFQSIGFDWVKKGSFRLHCTIVNQNRREAKGKGTVKPFNNRFDVKQRFWGEKKHLCLSDFKSFSIIDMIFFKACTRFWHSLVSEAVTLGSPLVLNITNIYIQYFATPKQYFSLNKTKNLVNIIELIGDWLNLINMYNMLFVFALLSLFLTLSLSSFVHASCRSARILSRLDIISLWN